MRDARDRIGRLRVVVADDSALLRRGVVRMLEQAGCDVVAEAEDVTTLLAAVARERPDVATVDIRMPPTMTDEGIRAAGEIRRAHPEVGVLVLSQYLDEEYAARVLAEAPGGVGYLLKESVGRIGDLAAAVTRVAHGGTVVDPALVRRLLEARERQTARAQLTTSQQRVLELMAEGMSNAAIAERLVVSHRTVESHVRSLMLALDIPDAPDVNRRVRAVLAYLDRAGDT